MKCCTIGGSASGKGGGHKGGRGSKLARSARACKGKKGVRFRACVKAKIKKMR
jgi:hypothetical protein